MNKKEEYKYFEKSEEKRASELSELLKNEREWLRTCRDSEATLIIASLELPVKVIRLENNNLNDFASKDEIKSELNNKDKKPRFKLQSSQLSLMRTLHGHRNDLAKTVKFVGWPGIHVSLEDEKEEIIELLEEIDCIPVFPPETEFEIFNEFCHIYLWSLFHNILNTDELNNTPFNHEQWRVYHQMNLLWSSIITPMVSPDNMDMVWINDYHLLLLCQYMNRKVKGINIGLFLHIPFPSYEIFRCLPVREELLRSILMADLIGFHFFPYAKQFLSSCRRLLGVYHYFKPGGLIGIDKNSSNGEQKSDFYYNNNPNKQETIVRIGHVHIQCDDILQSILLNQEIRIKALDIRERYINHFIFVSIDRLDQLSGLQLKLRAFDLFLQNYPYIKNKQPVVLIQYIFPTNTLTFEKREKLIQSLINLTNEINLKHSPDDLNEFKLRQKNDNVGCSSCNSNVCSNDSHGNLLKFKNPVVELKYGPITQEEKYALFLSGDCLFDTSVRDGLNVNPFEYIACKDESLKILNQHQFFNNQQSTLGSSTFRTCTSFSRYSSSFSSHSNSSSNSNSSEQGESSGNDEYSKKKSFNNNRIVMGPYCTLKSHKLLPCLIISEFTGCSNTLSSPYRVNPWNLMNMVETLDRAVSSIKYISNEKKHHWKMDRAYLLSHSTVYWAKEFIMDLRIFSKKKKNDTLYHTTYGIGPSLKGISINLNSKQLNLNTLIHIYRKINNKDSLRIFLLDNEGTLTPDYRFFFNNNNQNIGNYDPFNDDNSEVINISSKNEVVHNCRFSCNKNPLNSVKTFENGNSGIKDGVSSNKDLILKNIKDLSIEIPRHYDDPNIIGDDEGNRLIEDILTHDISCSPPVEIKEALRKLCSSKNNLVIVFSGRNKQLLDDWFGDIENIGLCAEHGYYLKLPKVLDSETPNVWKKLKIHHDANNNNNNSINSCLNGNGSVNGSFNDTNNHNTNYKPISYLNESGYCDRDDKSKSKSEQNDLVNDCSRVKTGIEYYHSMNLNNEYSNTNSDEYEPSDYDLNNIYTKYHELNPMDWKNITLQLMEQYVLRTQGSYIENKGTAIVFQYKFCEPYFGSWQAKELYNYLVELLVKYPVNIITGVDFVEVRLNGINKGVAVRYILDKITLGKNNDIDMILCIGDDRSDEDMFSVVNQYNSKVTNNHNKTGIRHNSKDSDNTTNNNIFTVVIGKHNSIANHFLHSTEEVSYIIQTLSLYT
ncbi:trehalose-phosphate synthase domain-containing [Cryptosporidium bovis]|uniref:trehalose-phosphate synthase domain-containing n=1 Tax=Cryptosporidium bovis TaxID=310047 RepID=UPI00351A7E5E|nr:trehalose-phosphate synthase domain-containing [Cryptosporidium bovis]